MLSFRDISQRYALDRLKDEFISTVSHELRTPLTSIRGALGLLSSGILGEINDKAANLLRIALTNSDRLVRLINDILDLERVQSGREPLVFRPVQMADLVRQAMDGMQLVAEEAGVLLIHDKTQVEIDRRRRPAAAGAHQPAFECGQVFAAELGRIGDAAPRLERRHAFGHRPGPRHSRRQAGGHLRALPAGGRVGFAAEGRQRTGPGHLPRHRDAAHRAHLGRAQSGARFDIPRLPALPSGCR